MKKFLMILIFVSISVFSFAQTTVNTSFTKSFTLTEWYEVESSVYYDLLSDTYKQKTSDISDNILDSNLKGKLIYNIKNKTAILTLTNENGTGNINFKNKYIIKKHNIDNGISYDIVFSINSTEWVAMRLNIRNDNTCSLIEFKRNE